MIPSDLKDAIQAKFDPFPEDAVSANLAFGQAVQEYLQENCSITYAWVGANPSGTPDPVVSFTAKPTWVAFVLAPSADFNTWIISLSGLIQTAIIAPDDSTFVLTGALFGPTPLTIAQSGLDTHDDAILDISTNIVNGVKLMINPTPVPGVHGVFTGTATMALIS